MRVSHLCLVLSLFVTVASFAQTSSSARPAPGFSLDTIDKSVDPCVDFYQYACGNWIKNSEIPPDQSQWVSFVELSERNRDIERGILEKAAAGGAGRDAVDQKIGDLYGSCMDEKTVDAKGIAPLKPELDRIAAVQDKAALIDEVAHVHLAGPSPLFNFYSASDLHNADQVIAYIDQGGLSLPDRDYYIKDDNPKMKEMRQHLVEYVTQALILAGQMPQQAADSAQTVLRIETALAKASMDRTARRDPKNRDHKMSRDEAVALGPNFYLNRYFTAVGAPSFSQLNVTNPDFFKQVNGVLESESLDSLKAYLSWHVLHSAAPWLSQPFVDADFKFQQNLTGQKEIQARWKRCVNLTDRELGEALGQRYVDVTFGPEGKQRMLQMVDALEKSLAEDIHDLSWMSDETKKQAKVKLDAIRNKIGYPDRWRDYSSVTLIKTDFLGNVDRAHEFESRRDIAKIGTPVDHSEWDISPPTVDAYYNPQMNDINFPAGVLQPPIYDAKMDAAPNYGDTGGTIGHELTHGFDDEGSQFDAQGNLKDWWTKQDREHFDERTKCVKDQYAQYVVVDDVHINSELTLGEDVADLGGEILAYMAWRFATKGEDLKSIDGLTPEQRFFIGFAQWDCANERPEDLRVRAQTDPHSPAQYRINGVAVNMTEFAKAFSCKAGQPMVKPAKDVCSVW